MDRALTLTERMSLRKRQLEERREKQKQADYKRWMREAGNPTFTPDLVKVKMQSKYPEEDMDYIRGWDDGCEPELRDNY